MQITFNLQHVLNPGSSLDVNTDALRILRECLARLNRARSHNGVGMALYQTDGHCVHFDIPFAFYEGCSEEINAACLHALMHCLIAFNTLLITTCGYPITPLYDCPVYYRRTTVWDAIPAMYNLGYGDCKSLTAALVAEYRARGVKCNPVFRFNPPEKPGDGMLFHILVQTEHGYEDPSKMKGMGANEFHPMYRQS